MPLKITQLGAAVREKTSTLTSRLPAIVATTLSASLLVTGSVVAARWLGWLQGPELAAYDHYMRRRPVAPLDDRLLVVGVDETDIQTRQEFPIRDRTLADVLTALVANDPLAIGVDIARDIPQGDGRAELASVMAKNEQIISGCQMSGGDNPGVPPAPGAPPERTAFADFPKDPDGIVRRSILVSVPGPSEVPLPVQHLCNDTNPENQMVSLHFSMALAYLSSQGIEATAGEDGEIQLGQATLHRLGQQAAGYRRTQAYDYQVLMNYQGAEKTIRVVSLSDVLKGAVKPDWIRGKVVLIGYTSAVAKDLLATPFSAAGDGGDLMPGVEIHAQGTSQLISAALGERPLMWYWPWSVEVLWILGWAIAGGAIAYTNHRIWLFIVLEQALLVGLYLICFVAFIEGGWLPLIPAVFAVLGSAFGVALLSRADEGGYTQAIYEQMREKVKGMVQPKIEIDQAKREREVSEITDSGYFQDLVSRAKTIREQRKQSLSKSTLEFEKTDGSPE
ncbi:CHASE2 domain-containing protein [Leptolyngbya sp. FACHB-16]|nr:MULTISPECIES: CHASE2 domain-containing protein [unclassified Leptolyngbya]MBD1912143.1 CHASE2 domain-containing protein [Leptolyngbya sp. FACHB-8]MBD2155034.1 CHASE2 domain-containing protein [Leptolyngbya sp. FACHB-16]